MDCSPPGSSVHGILQARVLSELPCPPTGDLLDPGIEPESFMSPVLEVVCLFVCFFTTNATWEVQIIVYLYVNWNNPRKGRNAWCKSQVRSFKIQNYRVDNRGWSLEHKP